MATPLGTFRITTNHLTGDGSSYTDAELQAICTAIKAALVANSGVTTAIGSEFELARVYWVPGVDTPSAIGQIDRIISAS